VTMIRVLSERRLRDRGLALCRQRSRGDARRSNRVRACQRAESIGDPRRPRAPSVGISPCREVTRPRRSGNRTRSSSPGRARRTGGLHQGVEYRRERRVREIAISETRWSCRSPRWRTATRGRESRLPGGVRTIRSSSGAATCTSAPIDLDAAGYLRPPYRRGRRLRASVRSRATRSSSARG